MGYSHRDKILKILTSQLEIEVDKQYNIHLVSWVRNMEGKSHLGSKSFTTVNNRWVTKAKYPIPSLSRYRDWIVREEESKSFQKCGLII